MRGLSQFKCWDPHLFENFNHEFSCGYQDLIWKRKTWIFFINFANKIIIMLDIWIFNLTINAWLCKFWFVQYQSRSAWWVILKYPVYLWQLFVEYEESFRTINIYSSSTLEVYDYSCQHTPDLYALPRTASCNNSYCHIKSIESLWKARFVRAGLGVVVNRLIVQKIWLIFNIINISEFFTTKKA